MLVIVRFVSYLTLTIPTTVLAAAPSGILGGGDRVESVEEPFKTITGAQRGEKALVVPIVSYAQQGGGNRSVEDPMHTNCTSTKDQNTVIAAHITKFHEGSVGHAADEPLHTITSNSDIKRPGGNVPLGIVAATIERQFGASAGASIAEPLGTVMAGGGGKSALVTAFFAQHNTMLNSSIHPEHSAEKPMSTVTTTGSHQGVVAAHLITLKGSDRRGLTYILASETGASLRAAGWRFL